MSSTAKFHDQVEITKVIVYILNYQLFSIFESAFLAADSKSNREVADLKICGL